MYKAAAIDADGDIWGQRHDGTWECITVDACGPEDTIGDVSARFGPLAICSLIKVEE